MSPLGFIVLAACSIAILTVPRKFAPVVLIVGCCYMTVSQALIIAGTNFPVFRLLIMAGIARVILRSERLPSGLQRIDKLFIFMCVWIFFASFFHEHSPGSGPKYALGGILNTAGTYFLFRIFLVNHEDVLFFIKATLLLLVPVAAGMVLEQVVRKNVFSALGGVPDYPVVRDGRVRAQGPFRHPILAGTIGATCLPFAVALWQKHRMTAVIGGGACLGMIVASASSGPIMSAFFAVCALGMWRYRQHCRRIAIWAAISYLPLSLIMERPPYYIMAYIDLTGSSTAWHRAFLIESTIDHFSEWWLFGTDYTRHWMPRQGAISPNHTDITNQYIATGVNGGFLAMLLLIAVILYSFHRVGVLVANTDHSKEARFTYWCIGASLFSNAATSMSVAFFGQAQVFFWLPIAIIGSIPLIAANAFVVEDPETQRET
jgi:hypothetical protein